MKFLLLLAALPLAAAQDKAGAPDAAKVEAAISKGVEFLKINRGKFPPWEHFKVPMRMDDLILWTFLHSKVPASDPVVEELLKATLGARLERTYLVSLHAMALADLDKVKYQDRLRACAQFLADNQCKNGQWSYGEASLVADDLAAEAAKAPEPSPGKTRTQVSVKQTRVGPDIGDHSNSQYAILGIRACYDAGVLLPRDVLIKARQEWELSQKKDGGWCYGVSPDHGGHVSYGSMTAGGVASLVICKHLLGEDWHSSGRVKGGLKWLADHYTVAEHPGPSEIAPAPMHDYYYYLYAMERACSLSSTDKLADHAWHGEGARRLLERQHDDGSWLSPTSGNAAWDTCFALLFLDRATGPVETKTGAGTPKKD